MKKIFYYIILIALVTIGCKKDDTPMINGQKPEVRMAEAIAAYKADLINPNGWKLYLKTNLGGGYGFYCQFTNKDRVKMLFDDIDIDAADAYFESTYRIKAVMAPSLLFDTYNYIHLLTDPDGKQFGGVDGKGYESDFEFELQSKSGDTIMAVGKKRRIKALLIKATTAEKALFDNGGYKLSVVKTKDFFTKNKFLYLDDEAGFKQVVFINTEGKSIKLIRLSSAGEVTTSQIAAFAYTLNGIILLDTLKIGANKIYEMNWNANKLVAKTQSGNDLEIKVSPSSVIPLYTLIGAAGFSKFLFPNVVTYEGWSTDFSDRKAKAAAAMLSGPYKLRLDFMYFTFNEIDKTALFQVDIYQGTSMYGASFTFNYSKNADKTISFAKANPFADGNGRLVEANLNPLFTERFLTDKFNVDFFQHSIDGTLAQFKSVEHPDFTFTMKY